MLIYEIFIVKLFTKHELLGACLMTTQALQYCCLWMLWELKTLASIFDANAVGVPWFSGHSASHCLNTKGQLFVHGLTQTTVLYNQWTSGSPYKRIDLINYLTPERNYHLISSHIHHHHHDQVKLAWYRITHSLNLHLHLHLHQLKKLLIATQILLASTLGNV